MFLLVVRDVGDILLRSGKAGAAGCHPAAQKRPKPVSVLSLPGVWFSEVSAHTTTELYPPWALYWEFWECAGLHGVVRTAF